MEQARFPFIENLSWEMHNIKSSKEMCFGYFIMWSSSVICHLELPQPFSSYKKKSSKMFKVSWGTRMESNSSFSCFSTSCTTFNILHQACISFVSLKTARQSTITAIALTPPILNTDVSLFSQRTQQSHINIPQNANLFITELFSFCPLQMPFC